MNYIAKPPPLGAAGAEDKASLLGGCDDFNLTQSQEDRQGANARLAELKRDSIWRLARLASEHLDRLLCSVEHDDDADIAAQCRALVSHVRAVAILVNDLAGGS
jgi:hypothetical protein